MCFSIRTTLPDSSEFLHLWWMMFSPDLLYLFDGILRMHLKNSSNPQFHSWPGVRSQPLPSEISLGSRYSPASWSPILLFWHQVYWLTLVFLLQFHLATASGCLLIIPRFSYPFFSGEIHQLTVCWRLFYYEIVYHDGALPWEFSYCRWQCNPHRRCNARHIWISGGLSLEDYRV